MSYHSVYFIKKNYFRKIIKTIIQYKIMLDEHKVTEKIKVSEFIKEVKEYGYDYIEATKHTFFRLREKQRKIYTEETLKKIIFNETPIEVGREKNGSYAIIYNFNKDLLKIIVNLTPKKVYIVTFYILDKEQKRLFKNE